MLIGTRQLGAVHRVGCECIKTRFWVFIVPILPRASYYVFNARLPCLDGIRIPLSWTSVAAGYLRTFGWLAVVVSALAFGASWDPRWLGAGVVAAVVLVLAHRALGRISPDEARRRTWLRHAVGTGAPPEFVGHAMRHATLRWLTAQWNEAFPDHCWLARAETSAPSAAELPLLHALAEYSHQPLLGRQLRAAESSLDAGRSLAR